MSNAFYNNPTEAIPKRGSGIAEQTFSAFLQEVGAPVDGYFQRQGLPALCRDPNAFVPLQKAWAPFNDASRSEDRLLH